MFFSIKAFGWRFQVRTAAASSESPLPSPISPSLSSLPIATPRRPPPPPQRPPRRPENAGTMDGAHAVTQYMSEKAVKKPRDYLAIATAVLRTWQWVSATFVYISIMSLYVYIRRTHHFEAPLKMIQHSGLVSVGYSTIVLTSVVAFRRWKRLPGWSVFAWGTFAGDLTMMSIAVTEITVLSQAGVPSHCGGIIPTFNSSQTYSALLTQSPHVQPWRVPGVGHRRADLCDLPRTVFGFCVAAIFSHTLSILLTVFQIQRYHKTLDVPEPRSYPGHIDLVVPSYIAGRQSLRPLPRMAPPARPHPPSILRNHNRPPAPPPTPPSPTISERSAPPSYPSSPSLPSSSVYSAVTTYSSPSTSSSQTQYSTQISHTRNSAVSTSYGSSACSSSSRPPPDSHLLPAQDDPNKYANMPRMEVVNYNPRVSMESASTNPEIYLVADGFRPEEPPQYSSRPSSMYNGCTRP